MKMNRREFLFSAGAVTFLGGCRAYDLFGTPEMTFGVVSDIHVTTPKSCRLFERSLRQFRRRGVDAVVIPGDLTDWGLRSSLTYVKATWDKVFAGTDVVPLFCTGNHDYDGWTYGDMTMEMHANGYSEDEALVKNDIAAQWRQVFGEDFANVRCRTVKGFDFVSCEFGARNGKELKAWFDANRRRFADGRPFFFFQHLPIRGTTADSAGWADNGVTKPVLDAFPNCIAFTGHAHCPFTDERQIWQGTFTAVGCPSLSYAWFPGEHENGEGDRRGKSKQAMPMIAARRDLRGGQGFVVSVWSDRVVIERRDLEEEEEGAPAWLVPLPLAKAAQPYANGVRDGAEPVPQFPRGAELDIETRNTENRAGHWAIVLNCEFPSAVMPEGHRVFDYEIRAVPRDGSAPLVKSFFSPAYPKMAKFEPARQRFWFDVAELPQDKEYVIEVRARNCFGLKSVPLVSGVRRGKPGLDKAVREKKA